MATSRPIPTLTIVPEGVFDPIELAPLLARAAGSRLHKTCNGCAVFLRLQQCPVDPALRNGEFNGLPDIVNTRKCSCRDWNCPVVEMWGKLAVKAVNGATEAPSV